MSTYFSSDEFAARCATGALLAVLFIGWAACYLYLYGLSPFHGAGFIGGTFGFLLLYMCCIEFWPACRRIWNPLTRVCLYSLGFIFFVMMILVFMFMPLSTGERDIIFWLVMVVAVADTSALLVGKSLGGPKLLPWISPHKTWTGVIAAFVFGSFASVLLAMVLDLVPASVCPPVFIVLGSIVGDLFFSFIKRLGRLKDYGTILLGMGGLLDRFDSLLGGGAAYLIWFFIVT